jgi:hypothetical protein
VLPSCAGFMRRLFNCFSRRCFSGAFERGAKVHCRRGGQKRALRVMDSQPLLMDQRVLQEQQAQNHNSTEWAGTGEKLEEIIAPFRRRRGVALPQDRGRKRAVVRGLLG